MATQHGPIKLKGTIGDITFFKGDDGSYGAKAKSEVSAERIATDPKFLRTRENNREFGYAGTSGKLVRDAFQVMIGGADKRMVGRLMQTMMRCLKADTSSPRGERNVADGDLQFLQGFDFNVKGKLGTTLLTPFTTSITRTTGVTDVTIPPFVPTVSLSAPQGATHYKVVLGAAEIDFATNANIKANASSAFLPIDNNATTSLSLQANVTANTALPVLQVLGVHFFQEVNGVKYALNNGAFDGVKIVAIDL
jgi:hypothetical protein